MTRSSVIESPTFKTMESEDSSIKSPLLQNRESSPKNLKKGESKEDSKQSPKSKMRETDSKEEIPKKSSKSKTKDSGSKEEIFEKPEKNTNSKKEISKESPKLKVKNSDEVISKKSSKSKMKDSSKVISKKSSKSKIQDSDEVISKKSKIRDSDYKEKSPKKSPKSKTRKIDFGEESPKKSPKSEIGESDFIEYSKKKSRKRRKTDTQTNSPKKSKISKESDPIAELEPEATFDPGEFDNLSVGGEYPSESDEEETENVIRNSLRPRTIKFNSKRRKNAVQKFDVSKNRVCLVLDLLQQPSLQKRDVFSKTCNFQMIRDYSWDSFTYILDHMRLSILNEHWSSFSELLVLLMRHPGATSNLFKNLVKEMAFLNLLVEDYRGSDELLNQFYDQFFTKIRQKVMKELEVWFKEY